MIKIYFDNWDCYTQNQTDYYDYSIIVLLIEDCIISQLLYLFLLSFLMDSLQEMNSQ